MARTKHPTPTDVLLPGDVPGHALTLAEQTETKDIESEMAFVAARAVGRLEALEFSETVSARARVEVYIELKQNKAYRALSYKDADGNRKRVSDLEEFCEHFLGKSSRRLHQMAANYHLLGSDLFEASQRIGFRNQDYNTLKALPADDQEAIKAAMQTDDRDQILDLMQELAVRHASQAAALKAEATDAMETAEARDQVVKSREAKISQLEESNHKLRNRIQAATPDEVGTQLRDEVSQFAFGAEAQILGNLRAGFQALADHGDAHNCTHENFMSGCLAQIESALLTIRNEFYVKAKPDADPVPDWIKDERPTDVIVQEALGAELAAFNARMAGAAN